MSLKRPGDPGGSDIPRYLIEVSAHDIHTAADRARTQIANLATKLQLGGNKPIVFNPSMWSKEKGNEFPAHATNRVINVHACVTDSRRMTLGDRGRPHCVAASANCSAPTQR